MQFDSATGLEKQSCDITSLETPVRLPLSNDVCARKLYHILSPRHLDLAGYFWKVLGSCTIDVLTGAP